MIPALACVAPALGLALASLAPPVPAAPPVPLFAASLAFDDLEPQLMELNDEFDTAQEDFYAEFRKKYGDFDYQSASKEEQDAVQKWWADNQPAHKFLPRYEALAVQAKGSDTAVRAWGKVLDLAQQAEVNASATRALKELGECVGSAAMDSIASRLQYSGALPRAEVLALLTKLRSSPHRSVVAAATLSLGMQLMSDEASEAERTQGRALMAELVEKFTDVKTSRGKLYSDIAAGQLYELDHLQIGMKAPDFEAIDETGATFRLSEYRGKVIVVDFWGFW